MSNKRIISTSSKNATQAALETQTREEEQVQEAPLSSTVESELDDLFTTETPHLEVKRISIGEADYPMQQLLPSMPSLPRDLYYVGNFQLLTSKIVSISMSARPKGTGRSGQRRMSDAELVQAQKVHDAAVKDAKFIASQMAVKKATILVESVRPHDMDIIGAALRVGGSVIISTPVNINHRNNALLQTLESEILDGRVLVISRTNTENFGKWNTREGDENHELMAALAARCYIVHCASQWQGTWIMAIDGKNAGKEVFVKNTGSQLHTQLINQYGCKPFNFQAHVEA